MKGDPQTERWDQTETGDTKGSELGARPPEASWRDDGKGPMPKPAEVNATGLFQRLRDYLGWS